MSSNDLFLKASTVEWARVGTQFTGVIAELEKEIFRMREKRLSEDLINQKDAMIETLISFYNCCDQLITAYRVTCATKQMEIHILNDIVSHAMQEAWSNRIVKRFTDDIAKLPGQATRELNHQTNG